MDAAEFTGRVAVVTGASGGIGAAVAAGLAAGGAVVAALDLDGAAAAAAAPAGGRGYACDVTDSAAVDAVIDRIETELGPIAMLANVAGVLATGDVVDTTDAQWSRPFDVNATGVFTVSRAAARVMITRGAGAIVTVGSNAAGVPRASMAAYGASKAAATMFTKCLGLELSGHGIRCNVVSPGSTDTPMQRGMWGDGAGPESVIGGSPELFKVGIPLGRIADPSDVADSVVFLLSDRARHITMHDLYVDGGATLKA